MGSAQPNRGHSAPDRYRQNQPAQAPLQCAQLPQYITGMTNAEIARRLELLRVEHRDLDSAIAALAAAVVADQLAIARLKKRKLLLRDEIAWLEDRLVPDIIA